MAEIGRQYRNTHENLLDLVESLTDDQIAWTPNETTPSVGFHVWHLARWADYLQEIINGRGSQIWEKEGLAARWNLETKSLGYAQTGMEMDEKTVMLLRMPKKAVLLDYACRAFAAALPPRACHRATCGRASCRTDCASMYWGLRESCSSR